MKITKTQLAEMIRRAIIKEQLNPNGPSRAMGGYYFPDEHRDNKATISLDQMVDYRGWLKILSYAGLRDDIETASSLRFALGGADNNAAARGIYSDLSPKAISMAPEWLRDLLG